MNGISLSLATCWGAGDAAAAFLRAEGMAAGRDGAFCTRPLLLEDGMAGEATALLRREGRAGEAHGESKALIVSGAVGVTWLPRIRATGVLR